MAIVLGYAGLLLDRGGMEEPMCLSQTLAAAHPQPAAAAGPPHPDPRPGRVSRRGLLAVPLEQGSGGPCRVLARWW
jgi:hypothetical protein